VEVVELMAFWLRDIFHRFLCYLIAGILTLPGGLVSYYLAERGSNIYFAYGIGMTFATVPGFLAYKKMRSYIKDANRPTDLLSILLITSNQNAESVLRYLLQNRDRDYRDIRMALLGISSSEINGTLENLVAASYVFKIKTEIDDFDSYVPSTKGIQYIRLIDAMRVNKWATTA
jgi:hypothetical protein